jgi:hypothetical protein
VVKVHIQTTQLVHAVSIGFLGACSKGRGKKGREQAVRKKGLLVFCKPPFFLGFPSSFPSALQKESEQLA